MRIAAFGGGGRVGRHVVSGAAARGHEVRVLVRSPQLEALHVTYVVGDVLSEMDVERVLSGCEAVVSTLGVSNFKEPGTLLSDGMRTITRGMRRLGIRRVVALAGAGVLDARGGGLRQDQPGFPADFRAISAAHAGTWDVLRESRLDWTLVCTGDQVDGSAPSRVRMLADRHPDGTHQVGIQDIAAFILDQLSDTRFLARRVGLCWSAEEPGAGRSG